MKKKSNFCVTDTKVNNIGWNSPSTKKKPVKVERKNLQRFLSHSILVIKPVTNGENSEIHAFPIESYFAKLLQKQKKESIGYVGVTSWNQVITWV